MPLHGQGLEVPPASGTPEAAAVPTAGLYDPICIFHIGSDQKKHSLLFFFLLFMKHNQTLRLLEQTFPLFGMGKTTHAKSVALVVTRLLTLTASSYANPVAAFGFAAFPAPRGTAGCCKTGLTFCTKVGGTHAVAGG